MKIARLVATVVILLNKGSITARELAERFEVSTRTIYRDVEALASAGIPVYATQGNSGGISLLENYQLDRTMFTVSESEGLLFALKTLQAVRYPEADAMLDKLGALFKNTGAPDWVEVEFSPWGSGPDEEAKFTSIRMAILAQTVLEFDYVGADGQRSHRTVEPVKLYFKGSAWYLRAWSRERGNFRTFRITRIRNLAARQESFEIRPQVPASTRSIEDKSRPPVLLKLRFQPRAAYRVYDDFDDALIARNADGTLEIKVEFPEDEWVYGYLLSYGPDVEVLEPEHLRDILRSRMLAALKKYPQAT